jgi:hypothetical protein
MFFKKSIKEKDILFYPNDEHVAKFLTPPKTSSSSNIPNWHKSLPKYMYNDKKFVNRLTSNLTAKSCLPLTDAFTAGYVFTLPYDVYTSKDENGNRFFSWSHQPAQKIHPIVAERPIGNKKELTGWNDLYGYEDLSHNWWAHWGVKTPPGYSCIFTHPINRTDLPFYTLGGILDADDWGEAGYQPFLMKKDWEGTISVGTPFMQVIPFKRENWKHTVDNSMTEEHEKNISKQTTFLQGFYKNKIWKNKTYR